MRKKEWFQEFFTGINYWASDSAINMWESFEPAVIENDLRLLRDAGITHLRVFPLWSVFQPLKALYGPGDVFEYGLGEQPLPDTPAGRVGVSEKACEDFSVLCDLAEQYGLKLIVGLITGHMSFRTYAPPAFEGKALLRDPTVLKWQLRFVKYFVSRFKSKAAIVGWDLGNETVNMPGCEDNPDAFYVWSSLIADAIRVCDGVHPVISGLDNSGIERSASNLKTVGEMCDIHTSHPYNIFQTAADPLPTMKPILDLAFRCNIAEDIAEIPTFIQEFGAIGYMNCSRRTEADFYRCAALTALAHGCHGIMWWCAFDQGQMEFAPYRWNTIGSDYGFYDRELCPKQLVEENRLFKERLSKIPGGVLPPHARNGTIIVPRDDGGMSLDTLRASYLLAKQANMDVHFSYSLDSIPESPLYIFPSISSSKSIPLVAFHQLLERVRGGATLYISADTGLLRDIPAITGVDIAYREKVNSEKIMTFGGEKLPIKTTFSFCVERVRGEILAADEAGNPVFFKNAYGKGTVYFLTLPLEKYLSGLSGAFFREDVPDYSVIYRELAIASKADRIADCDSRFLRLTEHWIDDSSLYIFAINYSHHPVRAHFKLRDGYRVEVVFGADYSGEELCVAGNDGLLLKATKEKAIR